MKNNNNRVRPKKFLGQHFLCNTEIAEKIAGTVNNSLYPNNILEVGPGMGVLTKFLWQMPEKEIKMVELDNESVAYLQDMYPDKCAENRLINADFLRMDITTFFNGQEYCLIGNYPYNISSQILFKAVENREQIPIIAGMFQKEVAERVASKSGCKAYGIISVWVQAFYDAEYLFTVSPNEFNPPPKVQSGVIILKRKENYKLPCCEKRFLSVVKTAFGQRRKTLRNALKSIEGSDMIPEQFLSLRAEQLSVSNFIEITVAVKRAEQK